MTLDAASGVVPTSGWYVEIDIAQSGTDARRTVTPEILGGARWTPTVNQLPEVELSVAPQPYFIDGRADSAPCRVWLDGVRLPIEEVTAVQRERGNRQDTLTLRAIGGVQLQRRVQRVYQNIPAVDAVESLITTETDLVANVDDPKTGGFATSTNEDILLTVNTSSGFKNSLTPVADDFSNIDDDTSPLTISDANDDIRRLRTSFLWSAGNPSGATLGGQLAALNGATRVSPSGASHTEAISLDSGSTTPTAETNTTFTTEYKIPADAGVVVGVRARRVTTDDTEATLEIEYETNPPNQVGEVLRREQPSIDSGFEWVQETFDASEVPIGSEITARAIATPSTGSVEVDAIAVYDARVSHTLGFFAEDEVDANGNLRRPSPYGPGDTEVIEDVTDAIRVETADDQLSQSTLSGARTVLSLSTDAANVEVSATAAGETTRERSVTETVVEPGDLTDRASGGFGLTGTGSQNASPSEGIVNHELESFEVRGLVTGEERLIGRSFDDDLVTVLGTIADDTNSVWEITVTDTGSLAIEWSKPGLRSTQDSLPASAVEYERETQTTDAATVIGGAVEFEEEISAPAPGGSQRTNDAVDVTAQSYSPPTSTNDIDAQAVTVSSSTVQLSNDRIVAGAERVVEASNPAVTYQQVQDYEIDYLDGELIVPSGSSITEGLTLLVEYRYHPTGRFESPNWDNDPRTDRSVTVPTVKTEGAAEQAARQLVRQTADSRVEATVDLSGLDPATSVVSALGIDELSELSDSWRVQSYVRSPQSPELRLSTGRPVSEFVAELTRQFKTLRSRV